MKMKISHSKVVDVGELLDEIEEFLADKNSFDLNNPYEKGSHDQLRWVRNKLRSLPEEETASIYDDTFGRETRP